MSRFSEIYDMQRDLNKLIGRDTVDDPNKMEWVYDYAQALEDEIVELKNCINWKWWSKESKELGQYSTIIDMKNAKIEAIDALHFFMSLIHISGDTDFEFFEEYDLPNTDLAANLFYKCELFIDIVRDIKNTTSWNDTDTDLSFLEGRLKTTSCCHDNLSDILKIGWVLLNDIFWLLSMNVDEIYNVYKLKHEKNIKRQENDYSVITKTEDDNNEIKSKI